MKTPRRPKRARAPSPPPRPVSLEKSSGLSVNTLSAFVIFHRSTASRLFGEIRVERSSLRLVSRTVSRSRDGKASAIDLKIVPRKSKLE